MLRVKIGLILVVIGCGFGCGSGRAPESKFTAPPHGGNILELPESHGFVELTTERDKSSNGGRKASVKSRILAYFYQPDGATAKSPAPTDVKLTLGPTVVALTPDTTEAGKFASVPGEYPDALRGQLDAQVDSKPVQVSFSFH